MGYISFIWGTQLKNTRTSVNAADIDYIGQMNNWIDNLHAELYRCHVFQNTMARCNGLWVGEPC
jgi:hypothetical protein